MTTDNNRGPVDVTPIVPLGIIPDSETVKPVRSDQLDLRVGGGLLLMVLIFLIILPVMLIALLVILLVPKLLPSWADLPVVSSFVLSLIGGLAALLRRSYLRYVRVRQV
ncbi:hypothetical protein ACFW6E_43835 [Streptomyces olivaceoviridis]|uniref:hypothetical protein n=1 Tax=Streptomyces olivaceoviridis TaxID=1921 RepID=UPI003676DEC6